MTWAYIPQGNLENYLSSLAQEADYSEADCLDYEPSAMLRKNRSALTLSEQESETDTLTMRRSGMTLEPSTERSGKDSLMLSQEASPANLTRLPESKRAQTITEISGLTQSGWFARYDRDSCLWRTSQISLFTNTPEPFSGTWPRQGMILGGTAYEQATQAHRTGETGSGLWPTPRANKTTGYSSDGFGPTLEQVIKQKENKKGAVNPDWEEWLMGWPVGWSSLEPLPPENWERWLNETQDGSWWGVDPADTGEMSRLTTVRENRGERLKALGNGQVPKVVEMAWEIVSIG